MKQLYQVVLLVALASGCLSGPAHAQRSDYSVSENGVSGDSGSRSRSIRSSGVVPASAYSADDAYTLDSTVSSNWESGQWVDSLRYKFYSHVSGDPEYSIMQLWTISQWEEQLHCGFTYDDNGRVVERIEQDWRYALPGRPYTFDRTLYSYDENGNLLDSTHQYWSSHRELWDETAQDEYSFAYDAYDNQIEHLCQRTIWSDDPPYWVWENHWRELHAFDVSNNKVEYILQMWDEDMSTWYNNERLIYGYDGQDNLTDSTTYLWEGGQWVPHMMYTYSYDNDDNQILEIHQYREDGQWINSWKFEYEYDPNNNQTRFFEQYWFGGDWDNSWEELMTYDAQNMLVENVGRYWNWSINVWRNSHKLTYSYDMGGNQIGFLQQIWDSNQWNDDFQKVSHYSLRSATETEVGSDVEITLYADIVLLFDSVSAAGNTTAIVADDGPGIDVHASLPFETENFIYVSTDAEYVGGIELCFPYDGSAFTAEEEDRLRVFHYQQGVWMNITTDHDKEADIICGVTEDLSPFALGVETGPTGVDDEVPGDLPVDFVLHQNYPNPFNPQTTVEYSVPARAHVSIEIFNIAGQKVRTLVSQSKPAGTYRVVWDGRNGTNQIVATGIYLYRFQVGDRVETKKMLLLK